MIDVVVLISGRGSNLQAIIDADLPINIRAVISNVPNVYGLERAEKAGIRTEVLDHTEYECREDFDRDLQVYIDSVEPDLVVLAGFMRILTPMFVEHYEGRIINIHPALLPAFPGLNTHERAIEAKVKEHGATVHHVTAKVDDGPIIIQASVPVLPDDTPDTLAARVLEQEHIIFPKAIRMFIEQRNHFRIHVGDEWVYVPPGYFHKERAFTRKELDDFYEAAFKYPEDHPELERYRKAILDKRVEFYHQYYKSSLTSE